MTDPAAPATRPASTIPATRAAWLATALGVPVYGAAALLASYAAAPVVELLAPDLTTIDSVAIFVGVAVINVLIALVGIMVVSHTVGRVVFARTLTLTNTAAGVAFGAMAAILSVPVVVFVAFAQAESVAGGVYAVLAVAVPCAFTAALTRAILPGIAASPATTRLAGWVAGGAVAVILAWTAFVLFGVGR